jgi:hypothetical protein
MSRPKTGDLAKKNSVPSVVKIKPFSIRNYNFYPCSFSDSLKKGYKYFLFCRFRRSGLPVHEINSPRFASKEDCEAFVESNSFLSRVIG